MSLKILSWNINGLRNKLDILSNTVNNDFDFVCIQENKLSKNVNQNQLKISNKYAYNYHNYSNIIKGHAGVSIYTNHKPNSVHIMLNDDVGRTLVLKYDKFYLICVYVPYSGVKLEKLEYKLKWFKEFNNMVKKLKKKCIIAGDFNALMNDSIMEVHKPVPRSPGGTYQEINMINNFIKDNFIDTFRYLNNENTKYSYWSYLSNCRKYNKGWRIDYIFTNIDKKDIIYSDILTGVYGSDHAPVILHINNKYI